MKSQFDRMKDGERYNAHCDEMFEIRDKIKKLLHKLNTTEYYTDNFKSVMRELLPNSHETSHFEPPFYCDYGSLIYAGEKAFINFGAVILDGGTVTIGAHTLVAPGVHIYTAGHPLDVKDRIEWEVCKPVVIGEYCWIGGHSTICPGVTIGDRSVIGAGAVVTKDIPADSLAVGNPAKVIRRLNQTDNAKEYRV